MQEDAEFIHEYTAIPKPIQKQANIKRILATKRMNGKRFGKVKLDNDQKTICGCHGVNCQRVLYHNTG